MALGRGKVEGGHKRGHSQMTHWSYTSEIKDATRSHRRTLDKMTAAEQAAEIDAEPIDHELDLWWSDPEDMSWFDYAEWKHPE